MRARLLVLGVVAALTVTGYAGGGKRHFSITGSYVEGCSCHGTCACELTGLEMGCEGVGAFDFTGGSFEGVSLAGARMAYSTKPGEWVVAYLDARNARQRKALEDLTRAGLAGFGKMEAVKNGKIRVWHSGNTDYATVDGGKIMNLKSQAVLGGDNKTPLVYSNVHDPFHPVIMQGKTISCSYKDGAHEITLKDSNAYFHHHLNSSGSL